MDMMVYGAGGHAKVVIDIIKQQSLYNLVGLYDPYKSMSQYHLGYPIIANEKHVDAIARINYGIIAIGDNWIRYQVAKKIREINENMIFITLIHPFTSIAENVMIGAGTVVMAGAVVQEGSKIGKHCIINTKASIDHDVVMDNYGSVAPGATIGGNVSIGTYSAIGLGANIIQKVNIGKHTVIGAGSTVLHHINNNTVAYGTPCRAIRLRSIGQSYLS